jgi:FMN phosphatase YigB (HAD superfamily)
MVKSFAVFHRNMKPVIFDIGNVIIKADHGITERVLQRYGVPAGKSASFFGSEHYASFSRGELDGMEFYRRTLESLGTHMPYRDMVAAHDRHMYEVDGHVLTILNAMPKDRLMFWTDTNSWQTARERDMIDVQSYSHVPRCVIRSDGIRTLKTDKGAIEKTLNKLGMNPGDVTMVDDNPAIIDELRNIGANAISYTTPGILNRDLKKLKLF